jgi:hypothetical protein
MRNAVKCALVSGLLAAGTLAPLCGAALAAPAPHAPSALVLAAAPECAEDTAPPARRSEDRPAPGLLGVRPDGARPVCPADAAPVLVTAGREGWDACAEPDGAEPGGTGVFAF